MKISVEINTTSSKPVNIDYLTYVSIGSLMTVLFFFALIENISVLIVYWNNKKLHTLTNIWIMAVVICDLLIVLGAFPFVIINSFAEEYILGDAGCKWEGFIITVLGCSSIFLLTGLSIHRCRIMLCNCMDRKIKRKGVMRSIMLCCSFGLIWGAFPYVGWGSFVIEGIGLSCAPNWRSQTLSDLTYTAAMYIFVLLIPLLVIVYCYLKILLKVWREKQNNNSWIMTKRVKRDIHVTITVALTIASFLVSWTPYAAICVLEAFFDMDIYSVAPILVQLPCLMAKTACIWNPIVYVSHNNDFRKAFLKQFGLSRKVLKIRLQSNAEIATLDEPCIHTNATGSDKDNTVRAYTPSRSDTDELVKL